jgi:hypothetical protein
VEVLAKALLQVELPADLVQTLAEILVLALALAFQGRQASVAALGQVAAPLIEHRS